MERVKGSGWLGKKICKLVEKERLGVRDLGEVMKALDMKFIWRLHSEDNLWLNFFKAKYVKGEHFTTIIQKQKGSSFLESFM